MPFGMSFEMPPASLLKEQFEDLFVHFVQPHMPIAVVIIKVLALVLVLLCVRWVCRCRRVLSLKARKEAASSEDAVARKNLSLAESNEQHLRKEAERKRREADEMTANAQKAAAEREKAEREKAL